MELVFEAPGQRYETASHISAYTFRLDSPALIHDLHVDLLVGPADGQRATQDNFAPLPRALIAPDLRLSLRHGPHIMPPIRVTLSDEATDWSKSNQPGDGQ